MTAELIGYRVHRVRIDILHVNLDWNLDMSFANSVAVPLERYILKHIQFLFNRSIGLWKGSDVSQLCTGMPATNQFFEDSDSCLAYQITPNQ